MAEEFYMSVTFDMPSAEKMARLESLIESLDLCEYEEARTILNENELKLAEKLIVQLTTKYSDYSKCKDLLKMFVATYNNCVDNMLLHSDDSGLRGRIDADGVDSGADSFCSAIILILIAMKATHIDAEAGSQGWVCRWRSLADGTIDLDFQTDL